MKDLWRRTFIQSRDSMFKMRRAIPIFRVSRAAAQVRNPRLTRSRPQPVIRVRSSSPWSYCSLSALWVLFCLFRVTESSESLRVGTLDCAITTTTAQARLLGWCDSAFDDKIDYHHYMSHCECCHYRCDVPGCNLM